MNFQFRAAGAAAVHHPFRLPAPSSDPTPDAGYNHPFHLPIPSSEPAAGTSRPSHLPVSSSDTAAGYFALRDLRVGSAGDKGATPPSSREAQKARIRAKILAEERILEEEVRRELEYERGLTERLSEVQSLGLLPPPIIPAQYLQPPQHLMRNTPVEHVQVPNNLWSGDERPPSFIPHPIDSRFLPHNPDVRSPLDRLPSRHLPPRYDAVGLTGWPSYSQTADHLAENSVSFPSHSDFNGKRKHDYITPSGPICYECGEEGHLSRVCKATIEARAAYKKCKSVGKTAMAGKREVTPEIHHNKLADMEKASVDLNQTCYLCGNKGHWSRVCKASKEARAAYKKGRTELPRKSKKCKQCGNKDHLRNACNASMESRDASKKHKRMKARGEAAQAAASKIKEHTCYLCGEMGHWSRTCKATREVRAVYKKKMDEISQAAAENQV